MSGSTVITVIATVSVLNTEKVARLEVPGRIRSSTVMSLEKRVYILPMGFESKNRILALMRASTILLCILVVEVVIISKMMKFLEKVRMM